MASFPREFRQRDATRMNLADLQTREQTQYVVSKLGGNVLEPGEPIEFKQLTGNSFKLLSGVYSGFDIPSASGLTQIEGSPGCEITGPVSIDGVVYITGVIFKGLPVRISPTGGAHFVDCVFASDTDSLDITDSYLLISSGGRATFTGCSFVGTQSAGSTVNNLGPNTNVYIANCYRGTTTPHINCSIISEVT